MVEREDWTSCVVWLGKLLWKRLLMWIQHLGRRAGQHLRHLDAQVRLGRRWVTRQGIRPFLHRELADVSGRVLDLGSSGGTYADLLPSTSIHLDLRALSGVDVVATAYQLPFRAESFDCVVCTEVLEHLEYPRQAIAEIKRLLRPGGKLILTTRFIFPVHSRPRDFFRFTRYGLQSLLDGFQATVVEQQSAFMSVLTCYVSLIVEPRLAGRRFLAPLILLSALAMSSFDTVVSWLLPDDYVTSGYLVAAINNGVVV